MKNTNVAILTTFRVFDTIFTDVREARELLKGWEHKEKIYTMYMVIESDDIDLHEFKKGIQAEEIRGVEFYKNIEDARECQENWDN